jgi:spore maturation protein CgeB
MVRLLLVGQRDGTHVGGSLERAAAKLGHVTVFKTVADAFEGPALLRSAAWRLLDHRPLRLRSFGSSILAACEEFRPDLLLCTGLAPIEAGTLKQIGTLGIRRVCLLTDDPWNPAVGSRWFFAALPHYDTVFSTRRANLAQLGSLCRGQVRYLRFAYDPDLSQPRALSDEERSRLHAEVLFVGGADDDRLPIISALARDGFKLALHGAYWDRHAATRDFARGQVAPEVLCKATAAADISLCLVRRANRDGHVMRSFEIPVLRACMVVEDTAEHREIFGDPGEAVCYFSTPAQLSQQCRTLLADPVERSRMACAAYERVTSGANTYADRLTEMLVAGASA